VVTGASGYLGRRLVGRAATRADVVAAVGSGAPPDALPAGAVVRRLDVTDRAAVSALVDELRPDAVIHAAAANPGAPVERFEAVNVGGTIAVADAVGALGTAGRMVHVSTDVVLDGRSAPYADDSPPSPLNRYGASKAAAEAAVRERLPSAAVVRTSLIYGLHEVDRGTAGMAERLRRGEPLTLFEDSIRQPVWIEALAEGLVRLALDLRDEAGVLNLAGDEALSRAAFARRMLAWWRVDVPVDRVREVTAAGLGDVPLDLRLRLDRARLLGLATPGVGEVLGGGGRSG
jgi:dTDP-4-dehydrorhamnose reductase